MTVGNKVRFRVNWNAYRQGDETDQIAPGSIDLLVRRGILDRVEIASPKPKAAALEQPMGVASRGKKGRK